MEILKIYNEYKVIFKAYLLKNHELNYIFFKLVSVKSNRKKII